MVHNEEVLGLLLRGHVLSLDLAGQIIGLAD